MEKLMHSRKERRGTAGLSSPCTKEAEEKQTKEWRIDKTKKKIPIGKLKERRSGKSSRGGEHSSRVNSREAKRSKRKWVVFVFTCNSISLLFFDFHPTWVFLLTSDQVLQ
jgi:hypothetical protein